MSDRNAHLTRVLPDYRRWLYRLAHDLLPAGSPDVDDLVQEGYVAMWRALDQYDPARGSLPTWLTGAARLRMKDLAHGHGVPFGRTATRGKAPVEAKVSLEQATEDGVELMLDAVSLVEGIEWAYHRGEIAAAIDRLSPAQRRYVVGRFWLGLDSTSRAPGMKELVALVPEMKRAASLWNGTTGQRGARERLAADLHHLRDLIDA